MYFYYFQKRSLGDGKWVVVVNKLWNVHGINYRISTNIYINEIDYVKTLLSYGKFLCLIQTKLFVILST